MSGGIPSINPNNLNFSQQSEHGIERWAKTLGRTGPDFSGITKAFGSLMSNPSLIARGGAFVDPQQLQQDATGGYLNARSGVAQNNLATKEGAAQLASSAGSARSQIFNLMDQLKAQELNGQSSLFGSLLGGLF